MCWRALLDVVDCGGIVCCECGVCCWLVLVDHCWLLAVGCWRWWRFVCHGLIGADCVCMLLIVAVCRLLLFCCLLLCVSVACASLRVGVRALLLLLLFDGACKYVFGLYTMCYVYSCFV